MPYAALDRLPATRLVIPGGEIVVGIAPGPRPVDALQPVRSAQLSRVRPVTGTGCWSVCMTKQPRSALRTTLATRSGGSGDSISSVVSARRSSGP